MPCTAMPVFSARSVGATSSATKWRSGLNGNLTLIDAAGQLTTQTWNTDNRLTRVDNPDGSVEEMSYGADGHRRKKKVTPLSGPASDTIFVYDGQNLMQERDGSGLIVANYTWGPDRLNTEAGENWAAGNIGDTVLLQRRASTPGDLANGTTHYFGTDPSANIRLLIDPAGTVAGRMTYKAFGELFAGSGGILTPFLFGGSVGYYTDAMRRLNVGWRVYDPAAGRWTSLDPIGFDGGLWNLYGYVGNNPVNKVDPSGLYWFIGCRKEDEKALKDLFDPACNALGKYKATHNVWKAVDKCVACKKFGGPFDLPTKGKPDHPTCYQEWCEYGYVRCQYGKDCSCPKSAAMCVKDNNPTLEKPGKVITVCFDRTFTKTGKVQKWILDGCTSKKNAMDTFTYPACHSKKCRGDLLYVLHELQHICGTGGDFDQHPAANLKACCLIENLF